MKGNRSEAGGAELKIQATVKAENSGSESQEIVWIQEIVKNLEAKWRSESEQKWHYT